MLLCFVSNLKTWRKPEGNLRETWRKPEGNLGETWGKPERNLRETQVNTGRKIYQMPHRQWHKLRVSVSICIIDLNTFKIHYLQASTVDIFLIGTNWTIKPAQKVMQVSVCMDKRIPIKSTKLEFLILKTINNIKIKFVIFHKHIYVLFVRGFVAN